MNPSPHSVLYYATLLALAISVFCRAAGARAADFAIVAESTQRAGALQQRIAQTNTVAVITIAEADGLTAQDWSQHRIVWLLGAANDMASDTSKQTWNKLADVNGSLAAFVRQGNVLVISAADTSNPSLRSPDGAYFFPETTGQQSPSTIQLPNHPLVTGQGYLGVQLTDADFNQSAENIDRVGYWPAGVDGDIVATNSHGATAAAVAEGEGMILLIGVSLNPNSNLTGNLIRYAFALAQ